MWSSTCFTLTSIAFTWKKTKEDENTWRDVVRGAAAALQLNRKERLCMVLHVCPVKGPASALTWGCLFVWGSTCGQDTIVAFVTRSREKMAQSFPKFFFLLSKTTKMENNRRVIPASPGSLDKERSSGSQTSKAVFRTEAAARRPRLSLRSHYSWGIAFGLTRWAGVRRYCSALIKLSTSQLSETTHQPDWCSVYFLTLLCSLIWAAILVQLHLFISEGNF